MWSSYEGFTWPQTVNHNNGGTTMGGLGAPELIIVLVVVLVLFGGAKLPKLARSLGQASQEFKAGIAEGSAKDAEAAAGETETAAKKD
jgi:sec-independent protein translocase protein TatA